MSGPIVRKYGFPNFEQIFGKKEPQHGIDDTATPVEPPKDTPTAANPDGPKTNKAPDKTSPAS